MAPVNVPCTRRPASVHHRRRSARTTGPCAPGSGSAGIPWWIARPPAPECPQWPLHARRKAQWWLRRGSLSPSLADVYWHIAHDVPVASLFLGDSHLMVCRSPVSVNCRKCGLPYCGCCKTVRPSGLVSSVLDWYATASVASRTRTLRPALSKVAPAIMVCRAATMRVSRPAPSSIVAAASRQAESPSHVFALLVVARVVVRCSARPTGTLAAAVEVVCCNAASPLSLFVLNLRPVPFSSSPQPLRRPDCPLVRLLVFFVLGVFPRRRPRRPLR